MKDPNVLTVDGIDYHLPPVVMDILNATADERDRYRDALLKIGDESRLNIQKSWDAREALGLNPK